MTAKASYLAANLPEWVPEGALHYLAHTEWGQPIRALARQAGCHASTVLRQIRRIETRRDDPLVDAALRGLGAAKRDTTPQGAAGRAAMLLPDNVTLTREALRVLPRLCEAGAVLAVAEGMEKAVVVRDTASGGSTRTAVLPSAVAQAMALNDWIAAANTGRVTRYHITTAGRSALERLYQIAGQAPASVNAGLAEAAVPFEGPGAPVWEDADATDLRPLRRARMRYCVTESPVAALARRRDGEGRPFLDETLVHAGEHLREDFELAQMGAGLEGSGAAPFDDAGHAGDLSAAEAAQARVAAALRDLGPGLSDVALRCCCYLEGLETAERRLGWSARSAKIVLRIALMRLKRHYDETIGPNGPMIG